MSVYRAVRVGIAAALVERVAVGRVLEDSRGVVGVYNSVAVNVAAEIRRRRHLASERDEIASAALDIEYNVSVPVNRRDILEHELPCLVVVAVERRILTDIGLADERRELSRKIQQTRIYSELPAVRTEDTCI